MFKRLQSSLTHHAWRWGIGAVLLIQIAPFPFNLLGFVVILALGWLARTVPTLLILATAPLYLIPVKFSETAAIPIHEIILLLIIPFWVKPIWEQRFQLWRSSDWWIILLATSATLSMLWAVPEGRGEALRTWRWIIVEPILWFVMIRVALSTSLISATHLVRTIMATGAYVAGIGILQFVGVDLAPLLGDKRAFSENVVATGMIRRVASVYGHANNLGLMLDRVWPWAITALILPQWRTRWAWIVAACVAGGLLVSFSRGAWLASAVAGACLLIIAFGATTITRRPRLIIGVLTAIIGLAIVAIVGRGSASGSIDARFLLWQESLTWIQQRPFGLGLGQFYFYHNPEFGRSIMPAALIGTSEQYAAHPHNLLLDAWLNLGPIGVVALIGIIGHALWSGIRGGWQLSLPLIAAITLMSCVIHGSIDQFFFVSDLVLFFWALVSISQVDTTQPTSL